MILVVAACIDKIWSFIFYNDPAAKEWASYAQDSCKVGFHVSSNSATEGWVTEGYIDYCIIARSAEGNISDD